MTIDDMEAMKPTISKEISVPVNDISLGYGVQNEFAYTFNLRPTADHKKVHGIMRSKFPDIEYSLETK